MQIKESIKFLYTWENDKGTISTQVFTYSWDGTPGGNAPESSHLHDQLTDFLKCVGLSDAK